MPKPKLTILVGTTKGAFLIDGTADRTGWSVRGPFCNGWSIGHIVGGNHLRIHHQPFHRMQKAPQF